MKRRHVIAGLGGLALVGAGASWRVMRMPTEAIAPWQRLQTLSDDPRLEALRLAILAPNAHNRQPWLIGLIGQSDILLSCDLDKRLPETDPFDRQTLIGFGAFIELARIAAAEAGFELTAKLFPEGEPGERLGKRPVALLHMEAAAQISRDPLFAAIRNRRSNKAVYLDSKSVPPRALAALRAEGQASADLQLLRAARPIITRAIDLEVLIPRTHAESVQLMRIGADEIERNPDGIALSGPQIEIAALTGMLDRKSMMAPGSQAFETARAALQEVYGSLPALFWITTPGNSRRDQIEAGRRYVRANLIASARGLSMHPVSQSLQEYPEMAEQFKAIHRLLGAEGEERVQMVARLGFGPEIQPAPRWPLEKHLIS